MDKDKTKESWFTKFKKKFNKKEAGGEKNGQVKEEKNIVEEEDGVEQIETIIADCVEVSHQQKKNYINIFL